MKKIKRAVLIMSHEDWKNSCFSARKRGKFNFRRNWKMWRNDKEQRLLVRWSRKREKMLKRTVMDWKNSWTSVKENCNFFNWRIHYRKRKIKWMERWKNGLKI